MLEDRRSNEKIITLECYTDGSLKKAGKTMTFGGWGFIIVQEGKELYEANGSEYNTTNQRMELTAICKALEYLTSIRRPLDRIIIYSDSAYIINCYKDNWYLKWMTNGWTTATGNPVLNQDLWWQIIPYFDNFWYTFKKVKGHDTNFWNNKSDEIAQAAAAQLKTNWRGLNYE